MRAILISDIHLQARPPVARCEEPDWFAAMARPLEEVAALAARHRCPVLYAGDIFDRWNAGPEVINFALQYLPKGYAVPGQHDLPNHNYDEMDRSAYGVLVRAGHLENIPPGERRVVSLEIAVTGFPWGTPPTPPTQKGMYSSLEVALIHRFVWIKGCGYPGADESTFCNPKALRGYTVAAYGDNHKGFIVKPTKTGDPWVVNCGGFMRRKSDEREYRPGVGLLLEDGTVVRHYLDTTGERFTGLTEAEAAVAQTLDISAFVEGLRGLGGDALDFEGAMRRFMDHNQTAAGVRRVITEAMEA